MSSSGAKPRSSTITRSARRRPSILVFGRRRVDGLKLAQSDGHRAQLARRPDLRVPGFDHVWEEGGPPVQVALLGQGTRLARRLELGHAAEQKIARQIEPEAMAVRACLSVIIARQQGQQGHVGREEGMEERLLLQ